MLYRRVLLIKRCLGRFSGRKDRLRRHAQCAFCVVNNIEIGRFMVEEQRAGASEDEIDRDSRLLQVALEQGQLGQVVLNCVSSKAAAGSAADQGERCAGL